MIIFFYNCNVPPMDLESEIKILLLLLLLLLLNVIVSVSIIKSDEGFNCDTVQRELVLTWSGVSLSFYQILFFSLFCS